MKAVSQRLDSLGAIVSTVEALPSGRAGTARTLELIREHALAALTAASVLTAAAVAAAITGRADTAWGEVERVQQWVQQSIAYVLDPDRVELLQSPEVTLQRLAGDCDDHTALVCALLSVLGYQTRIVAVGFERGLFAHVYSEALIAGRWVAVETIKPWPLGKAPPRVVERMVLDVDAPALGQPLAGFLSSIRKTVTSVVRRPIDLVKNPIKTIKEDLKLLPAAAMGFAQGGPWGAVAAAAVTKVQMTAAQDAQRKVNAQARAAFEASANDAGMQIATAAGQPSRAAEFAARIKGAANAELEVQRIVSELQASGAAPAASPAKAATVTAVDAVPQSTPLRRLVGWIEENKTTAGIAGSMAAVLLSVALTRPRERRA